MTNAALKVVMDLCKGDMRRIINLLQSISMNQFGRQVSDNDVYELTGSPSPALLTELFRKMLDEDLQVSLDQIGHTLRAQGIALESLIPLLYDRVLNLAMSLNNKAFIIQKLGDAEYRISIGCSEELVLGSLVGAFTQIRK